MARAVAAVLLCAAAGGAVAAEALVRLPSEDDAVQAVLFDWNADEPPTALAVLFNGGGGAVGLLERIPRPGRNFLVRSRERFVALGVATALIDVPTDLGSFSDGHRLSARHARDVATVVADFQRRFPGKPVFLVGTSRGTVSAAATAAALGDRVAGVVLTSTVWNATRGGPGLSGFDFDRITVPRLLVHHRDDACVATPYAGARRLAGRAPGRWPLVTAQGGDPPRSEPCDALSAHGYLGIEAPVVDAIVRWMKGGPVPESVP